MTYTTTTKKLNKIIATSPTLILKVINLSSFSSSSFCIVVFFLASLCVASKATNLDNNEMAPIHIAGLRKALRQILENTMNTNVKVQINQSLHAIKNAAAAETARRSSNTRH